MSKDTPEQVSTSQLLDIITPKVSNIQSLGFFASWYVILFFLIIVLLGLAGFGYLDWVSALVNANVLLISIITFSYEPAKTIAMMALTPAYPEVSTEQDIETNHHQELALLIPAHNSASFIKKTIEAALAHFRQEQIFILDNGREKHPQDDTANIIHTCYPNVRYYWFPETGNKTIAVYFGLLLAKQAGFKYALTIDDDVLLRPSFSFRHELLEPDNVKGIVYPVRAITSVPKPSLMTSWLVASQDLEYQLSDLETYWLNEFLAVIRPHGAGSLWKIDELITILGNHNTEFDGEDLQMGIIMRRYHNPLQWLLRLDMENPLDTFVPPTVLGQDGYGNLWNQRVRSWNRALYAHPWTLVLKPLFTLWNRGEQNIGSVIASKESELYLLHNMLMHALRVPLILLMIDKPEFWLVWFLSHAAQAYTAICFNYLKLPANQRQDLLVLLTHPVYKSILNIMGTASSIRALLWDFPAGGWQPSIRERLTEHEIDVSTLTSHQHFFINHQAPVATSGAEDSAPNPASC